MSESAGMPVPEIDGVASLRVADHMSSQVRSVPATATLHEAARVLAEHEISCVVVLEADTPVGILSERDLVRHVVGDPHGWGGRPVREAMTRPLHLAAPDESIARAIADLSRHHIRRLPVVNAGGELVGIVTQTDLLRAAQQRLQEYTADLERLVAARTADLREIERRRDDLVDLTVHDIKNSLCVLDAALGLDGRALAMASVAPLLRRAVQRIRLLVYALLDINRLENGSMPLRVREVPWATLCEPLLAEAGVLARTKSIVVEASGERRTIVRCDPELVERVLLNLLDNAIGAAPEGSTVTVHAERLADGSFAVRIGNRGPVIPPDALATLFEKYRQGGDAAPVSRFGGWGLGLTFCRLAAELHGGSIRAVSPWVAGEGAAFELVVPAEPGP